MPLITKTEASWLIPCLFGNKLCGYAVMHSYGWGPAEYVTILVNPINRSLPESHSGFLAGAVVGCHHDLHVLLADFGSAIFCFVMISEVRSP